MGPLTGGGWGGCAGLPAAGFRAPRAWGAWGGHGWRRWFHATGLPGWQRAGVWREPSPEEETAWLRGQAEYLDSALEQVKARLRELEEGQSA